MVFEIGDEAVTAGFIEFRKDVVEENERMFIGFLTNEIGFSEFESKDDGA